MENKKMNASRSFGRAARRVALRAALLILACLLTMCPPALANNSAVQNVRDSVVRVVNVPFVDGYPVIDYMSHGTGIVVGDKSNPCVLTNRHVVEWDDKVSALRELSGSADVSVRIYILTGEPAVQSCDATLSNIRLCSSDDLALVRLSSSVKGKEPAVFGNSSDVKVTEPVYAIGFPGLAEELVDRHFNDTNRIETFLQQIYPSDTKDITVTNGTVSKVDVSIDGSVYIQHEANVSHGNSGGPLVDEYGHVIGINTLINWNSETAAKTHYAIDVSAIRRFMEASHVPFGKGTVLGGVIHKYIIWIVIAAAALYIVWKRLKKRQPGPAQLKTISDVLTRIYSSPDSDKLMVLTNPDYFVEQLKKYYREEFKADCRLLESASRAGFGKIILQYQNQSAIPDASDKRSILSELVSRCGFTQAEAGRVLTLFFEMVGWDGSVPGPGTSAGPAANPKPSDGAPAGLPGVLRNLYSHSDGTRLLSDPDYFLEQLARVYRPEFKSDCQLLDKAARSGLGAIILQFIQQRAEPSDAEETTLIGELKRRSGFSDAEARRAVALYGRMVGWSRY